MAGSLYPQTATCTLHPLLHIVNLLRCFFFLFETDVDWLNAYAGSCFIAQTTSLHVLSEAACLRLSGWLMLHARRRGRPALMHLMDLLNTWGQTGIRDRYHTHIHVPHCRALAVKTLCDLAVISCGHHRRLNAKRAMKPIIVALTAFSSVVAFSSSSSSWSSRRVTPPKNPRRR